MIRELEEELDAIFTECRELTHAELVRAFEIADKLDEYDRYHCSGVQVMAYLHSVSIKCARMESQLRAAISLILVDNPPENLEGIKELTEAAGICKALKLQAKDTRRCLREDVAKGGGDSWSEYLLLLREEE